MDRQLPLVGQASRIREPARRRRDTRSRNTGKRVLQRCVATNHRCALMHPACAFLCCRWQPSTLKSDNKSDDAALEIGYLGLLPAATSATTHRAGEDIHHAAHLV